MAFSLGEITYFTAEEVAKQVGVSRQTLWRWRRCGQIPQGQRYRGRRLVFSEEELRAILEFGHRIEPASSGVASSGHPNQESTLTDEEASQHGNT